MYQAILCNNCKYSLNILESINNVFVIKNMYLRFFFLFFSFHGGKKLCLKLACIVEEFSRIVLFQNFKE